MAKIAKAGRNDPCPCGSNKKYKKCCGASQQSNRSSSLMIAIVAAAILGAVLYSLSSRGEERASSVPGAGRVWSPEHGHWH
jgi:hypothetical protein